MGIKKSRWIIVSALIILAAGAAIYALATRSHNVRTAKVTRAPIRSWVEEKARTSLPKIFHITMPMEGRILPLDIDEGDPVKQGQVVAELEDIEWQENRIQVENILRAMENWVKASQAHVKASEISKEFNRWNWEANQKLAAKKAISELTAKDSRRQFLESEESNKESIATLEATRAFLAIMELVPAYVNRNLERTRIKSPESGVVLKRHVWNETVMTPGSPIMDIGNLEDLEITADILTQEAVLIRPGQWVDVFGTAVGEKPVKGRVRRIAPRGFKKISSLGVEEQRVPVYISLEKDMGPEKRLGLDYQVRVRIIIDKKEEALTIPRTALFRGMDNGWQVYALAGGRARLTPVTLGLLNDETAQILDGLSQGDEVIIAPETDIEDGVRVSPL